MNNLFSMIKLIFDLIIAICLNRETNLIILKVKTHLYIEYGRIAK